MAGSRRRFILFYATRDARDFEAFARTAAKLKRHGRVILDVAGLADKAFHDIPPGGNPWHEYCAQASPFIRMAPHPKLAPFMPKAFVKKNRDLLRAKVAVLKKLGLGAAYQGQEPFYVPEAFFRRHPGLRGPRIDHPRRGLKEEFALCTDEPEVREMYAGMMGEIRRAAPMLEAYFFNANDAGSGFCWAAGQYAGANGPRACARKSAGQRVKEFIETLHKGAADAGGDVTVYIGHCNFWRNEQCEIERALPPNSYFARKTPTVVGTGSLTGDMVPVLGLVNPLAVIAALQRAQSAAVDTVIVTFSGVLRRAIDRPETVDRVLEMVDDGTERPVIPGLAARLDRLHDYCATWGGRENADALFEAFVDLDQALALMAALVSWRHVYLAQSMRHLTRPLVFKPELLTPAEERTFLPYVFNIRESEARGDYIDFHGGRMSVGSGDANENRPLLACLDTLRGVAATLESRRKAPAGKWLFDLGTSVRVLIGCTRSTHNFYYAQLVRDRHQAELARENYVPVKGASWDGEGDILRFNELMRDEFDNANELIALFEERGLDQIGHAEDEKHQDTFHFGPDLIGDLTKKVQIMRDHWLDVEKYLAPPNK